MEGIKVCSEIGIEEINGVRTEGIVPSMEICNHPTNGNLVIVILDGTKYSIRRTQLMRGIRVTQFVSK